VDFGRRAGELNFFPPKNHTGAHPCACFFTLKIPLP
jgi:hypothetical protein